VDDYIDFHIPRAVNPATTPVHHTAIIGHPPEVRGWRPGDPCIAPRVHNTARIGAYVTIDAGTVRSTTVGPRTLVLKKVHIGHDAIIGEGCELATSCIIGGHVTIGNGTHVGLGAIILPHRTIGQNVTIGAGAIVTKDLPDGVTVAGNPARIIDRNPVPHTARPAEQRTAA
jgi:acetyltransferase-like isoleucine patch superfamily enzyme